MEYNKRKDARVVSQLCTAETSGVAKAYSLGFRV